MRFLNKVVFINSANIRYAEVAIDGNVHFIGTQGVGKSTSLRAILFFYNADKMKLGIEKGKKTFDEYYFPYGNSYIVYEVMRETGPYCIMAFKSQGRACFRFMEGGYDKTNFIDAGGKVMTWEGIRESLSRSVAYTRKIERYEEYRDILYGNNKGMGPEFRKFALIESRQYQNIPRTIQNVFLNSKLDAEFIKQTIIMSLNEEDVKIELTKYDSHLKDFDIQLADINKWTEQNKAGEIPVRKQAERVNQIHAAIRFLEREKQDAAKKMFGVYGQEQIVLPGLEKQKAVEEEKYTQLTYKANDLQGKFQAKREEIQKRISVLDNDIKRARNKAEDYERMNIRSIIDRVGNRPDREQEQYRLVEEKELLSSRFKEISTRFEALITQQEQALLVLENNKQAEQNNLKEGLLLFREEMAQHYKELLNAIRKQHQETLTTARNTVDRQKDVLHQLGLSRQKIQLQRYYEQEIELAREEMAINRQKMKMAGIDIADFKKQIESTQAKWELQTERNHAEIERKAEKLKEQNAQAAKEMELIENRLAQDKDSLYAWLGDNVPGWEQTIGKVIDEEQVLFHSGLSPRWVKEMEHTFFGLEIDLAEINRTVKTVADYQAEKLRWEQQVIANNHKLDALNERKNEEGEKLRRKYQPVIKELKEAIYQAEYATERAEENRRALEVQLDEWNRKAVADKAVALTAVEQDLEAAAALLLEEEQNYNGLEANMQKQIDIKEKEQRKKVQAEELSVQEKIAGKLGELEAKRNEATQRIAEIRKQQEKTLTDEGADTRRLAAIESALSGIRKELDFIEQNRDKVAEYNKDKRELLDLADDFKAEKKIKESQLATEQEKYELQKNKLQQDIMLLQEAVAEIDSRIGHIRDGLEAYEHFMLTDNFTQISIYQDQPATALKEGLSLRTLIEEVNGKIYSLQERYQELQAAINKFLSNFSPQNIFGFKTSLIERQEFVAFAEMLAEFLEEDKMAQYEKRVNERFATLIRQIGKETTELVSKEGEIQKVVTEINRDFEERNFAGVIKSIKLQLSGSQNRIVALLQSIKKFNDEHIMSLGAADLFSVGDSEVQNKKAITLLKEFAREIGNRKEKEISLSDSFELQFRIVENDNDSGWVEKLANVGSEGTDILVKAMINIMLLNVFKDSASKRFKDFRLHCMMDEIGKLHPNNVKGILKFANDRNILLINSSPTSYNATDYRYTYLLSKDSQSVTTVKRLIKKGLEV